jgi:hypothetical protein
MADPYFCATMVIDISIKFGDKGMTAKRGQIFHNTFTGNRSYFGGSTPVETGSNLEAFCEAVGFDYDVVKLPAPHPGKVYNPDFGDEGKNVFVPNQFHLVRSKDDVVVSPSTVSGQYGVISPDDIKASIEDIVSEGWGTPDTMMYIHGGRSEVIILKLDGQAGQNICIHGIDESWAWYLMIINSHGRGKCRGRIIAKRPVCQNQIAGLMSDFDWGVTHRGKAATKVANNVETWDALKKRIRVVADKMNLYAGTDIDVRAACQEIVGLKSPGVGQDLREVNPSRSMNLYDALVDGSNVPSLGTYGQTAMDVYNSVTSFNTRGHDAVKSDMHPADRAVRVIEGAGKAGLGLEMRAHRVLRDLFGL